MDRPGVLSTRVEDGIAIATLGSAERIHFDPELADCLYDTLKAWAEDESVRVVILTGGAPGYFIRHYSVAAIIAAGEAVRQSGITP